MKTRAIVTVAGWEDRFILSSMDLLESRKPECFLLYYYAEFEQITRPQREEVRGACGREGVVFRDVQLRYGDPVFTWKRITSSLTGLDVQGRGVLLNITTMPREAIWTALWMLQQLGARVTYVYYEAQGYNSEWLTRDPGMPRLVLKMSGSMMFGAETVLLVVTGYDTERVEQLRGSYEPTVTLLGVQESSETDLKRNKYPHLQQFGTSPGVKLFGVDAFSADHGQQAIQKQLAPYLGRSNIVMTSAGPKLSAIALYKLHCLFPETALAYTPSGEINREYSRGIGKPYSGDLVTSDSGPVSG